MLLNGWLRTKKHWEKFSARRLSVRMKYPACVGAKNCRFAASVSSARWQNAGAARNVTAESGSTRS